MSDSMDLQQQRMRTDMKAIFNQEEMRNAFDLQTDTLTQEQMEFHNLSDAQAESVRIKEILKHKEELNLSNLERRSLSLRYNRDRNFLLINNKQSSGDSPQMENLKDAIRQYEMFLRIETNGTAEDVERMSKKAEEMCTDVINACDAYLDRGAPFFFWRRGRYKEVAETKHRLIRERQILQSMEKEMLPTYGQYINSGESILDILSSTTKSSLAQRAELRKASKEVSKEEQKEDKEITKETSESKESEVKKENEELASKIGSLKIERDYAMAPKKTVVDRLEEFGEKFEKKEKKTKKDLQELDRKSKEKTAFDKADAREQKRIDKILKDCGAADFKNVSEETKRNLAALMGRDSKENRELLRKYSSGGAERQNAFLHMLDKFLSIDTKDVDLSSTDAMIKQSDRLEKIMDATYAMIRIVYQCDDIFFKMPSKIQKVIKQKMDVIQPMAAFYKNRKNLVTNKLYSESLDEELSFLFDPNATPEQQQLLRLINMDAYSPAYANCFKKKDVAPDGYPKDSAETKAKYNDYLTLGNAAVLEFSKDQPIGFMQSKHSKLLEPLLAKEAGEPMIYNGFVKDNVSFDGNSRESVVRHIANLTNLKPVDHMSAEEVRALIYRFCLRENKGMEEEEKEKIREQKKQAYRDMRDIMLAHVDYLKNKYGNGYLYLSPKEMLAHDEEITRDFHCNTNIGEFMIFINRHEELCEDKKEEINAAIEYMSFMAQANSYIMNLKRGAAEKKGINDAIGYITKSFVLDNMTGEGFDSTKGVLAVDQHAQKIDKINWDYKYEDKLEHKQWDKGEVDKLKQEAVGSIQAVEDYNQMVIRQDRMKDYTDDMLSGLKMVISIKKDDSQPKLSENEVKSLFFLSKHLDFTKFEKVATLYLKGKNDPAAMKEAQGIVEQELAAQFAKEAPPFREYAKQRQEIDNKESELKKEGKSLSKEDIKHERELYGKQQDIAYKYRHVPQIIKEVFPDFSLKVVDEKLLSEVMIMNTNISSKDMLFMKNAYMAYTTDVIERDIRDVEKKRALAKQQEDKNKK